MSIIIDFCPKSILPSVLIAQTTNFINSAGLILNLSLMGDVILSYDFYQSLLNRAHYHYNFTELLGSAVIKNGKFEIIVQMNQPHPMGPFATLFHELSHCDIAKRLQNISISDSTALYVQEFGACFLSAKNGHATGDHVFLTDILDLNNKLLDLKTKGEAAAALRHFLVIGCYLLGEEHGLQSAPDKWISHAMSKHWVSPLYKEINNLLINLYSVSIWKQHHFDDLEKFDINVVNTAIWNMGLT